MNAARIHDKVRVKSFWEQKIVRHTEHVGGEDSRMKSSALARLREEWLQRLARRNEHQQSFFDEQTRRAEKAQQVLSN